jgi:hypothetical protein
MNYSDSVKQRQKINNWKAMALVCIAIFLLDTLIQKAFAATYNLIPNPISTSAPFSAGPVNGQFSDTFKFRVVPNSGGSTSLTNIGFDLRGGIINDFKAVINGTINLVLERTTVNGGAVLSVLSQTFGALDANIEHSLVVSGNAVNASYGGNIAIKQVGAVPVPGAVWLFGSALVGLFGVGKRRPK